MNCNRFTVSSLIRGVNSRLPSAGAEESCTRGLCVNLCLFALKESLDTLNARLFFVVKTLLRALGRRQDQCHDCVSAV